LVTAMGAVGSASSVAGSSVVGSLVEVVMAY
jgi:hypothetical protein